MRGAFTPSPPSLHSQSSEMTQLSKAPWEAKAEACRKILRDSLNPQWLLPEDQLPPQSQLNVARFIETCGKLTPRELEITAKTATELTCEMAEGKLTAVETVTAFLKRAHIAHQLVNFATEFMVEDALAAAANLDRHFEATGKLFGPLHGVPISAKEHLAFKGRTCHSGYVAWAENVVEEDALVIRLAKAAGAVFHVRTNEPQSVMVCSSLVPAAIESEGLTDEIESISSAKIPYTEPPSTRTTETLPAADRAAGRARRLAFAALCWELGPTSAVLSGSRLRFADRMDCELQPCAIHTRVFVYRVSDKRAFAVFLVLWQTACRTSTSSRERSLTKSRGKKRPRWYRCLGR